MTLAVRGRALRALLALPLLALPASVQASGFALESQGARAMGFSGAYVAQAADPSAIYYNAAGIGFLKGKRLYVGALFGGLSTDFTGEGPYPAAGTLESSEPGARDAPDALLLAAGRREARPRPRLRRAVRLRERVGQPGAVHRPLHLHRVPGPRVGAQPDRGRRVEDRFAIGGGVDIRFSSLKNVRRLEASPNPFPVPTDVAQYTLDAGTDVGVGFNLGLLAMPTEDFSIGASYRHKVTIDHGAQASFVQIPTGNSAVDNAVALVLPANQLATATFTYPAMAAVGVALRRGYWMIEADFQWTLWSDFEDVTIDFPSTPVVQHGPAAGLREHWRGALGLEYLLRDDWELRGGYSFARSPQPSDTVSPFLNDEDRHALAFGGSYKYENLRVDAVARYLLYSSRSTTGLSRYNYNGLSSRAGSRWPSRWATASAGAFQGGETAGPPGGAGARPDALAGGRRGPVSRSRSRMAAGAPMPLEPGHTLGRYRLLEKLGEGGMGVVWRALDGSLGREVALKLLPDEVAQDPARLGRLESEARAIAALNHPGIVTLYSIEEADGRRFLTMELVAGRSLAEVIPAEGLALPDLLRLALPLAEAVSAAHRRGIVHRDLKPRNVMVTGEGQVKVLDFGLAQSPAPGRGRHLRPDDEDARRVRASTGTLAYMSPEQLQGLPVDPRTDVFSLGVVLYQMATGRRPFEAKSAAALISAILRDEPVPPTRLRPGAARPPRPADRALPGEGAPLPPALRGGPRLGDRAGPGGGGQGRPAGPHDRGPALRGPERGTGPAVPLRRASPRTC